MIFHVKSLIDKNNYVDNNSVDRKESKDTWYNSSATQHITNKHKRMVHLSFMDTSVEKRIGSHLAIQVPPSMLHLFSPYHWS